MLRITIILLALVATGCATVRGPYGNHIKDQPAIIDQQIAQDAVQQITTLYPPAKTRFDLQQPTPDVFGSELVSGLRKNGYALREFDPNAKPNTGDSAPGLPLRYVLDQLTEDHLYRLTIQVGAQAINRPYKREHGTVVPAGYWARKE